MARWNDDLKDRLFRHREIKITVTGRKSGRPISNPVWFVFEDDTLYLLPVQGSDTQWYKNVLHNPKIRSMRVVLRLKFRSFLPPMLPR